MLSDNNNDNNNNNAHGTPDIVLEKLINSGYHRARIKALSIFDRIAGGLSWGILSSRHHLNVEFVENASIREKIYVSEKICEALKSMHCPNDIRPHQIQGLDYACILNVVIWLLKRVEAARLENSFFVEQHTCWDFYRRFGTSLNFILYDEQEKEENNNNNLLLWLPSSYDILNPLKRSRAPKRQFIPNINHRYHLKQLNGGFSSPLQHVSSVLLEYGIRYETRDSLLMLQYVLDEEVKEDVEVIKDIGRMREEEEEERQMLENIMQQMKEYHERGGGKISQIKIQSVLQATQETSEVQRLRREYQKWQKELKNRLEVKEIARVKLEHKQKTTERNYKKCEMMRQKIKEVEEQVNEIKLTLQTTKEKTARREGKLTDYLQKVSEIHQHILSDPIRATILKKLMELLKEKEELQILFVQERQEGKQRVKNAKLECVNIANRIINIESGVKDDENWEIEYTRYTEQLKEKEVELSLINQKALDLLRLTDAYPTRSELMQIEMRIRELNEEVSSKYEEVKAAFSRHNTQMEILKCLRSEDSIMTQLAEKIQQCLQQRGSKAREQCSELINEQQRVVTQLHESQELLIKKRDYVSTKFITVKKKFNSLLIQQQHHRDVLELLKKLIKEHSVLLAQASERVNIPMT